MERTTTAARLRQIMDERGLRQVDLLRLVRPFSVQYNVPMYKQNISLYLSGKVEPAQDKLFILGRALNVSEAWLMGFDVPRDRAPVTDFQIKGLANGDAADLSVVLQDPDSRARFLSYVRKLAALKRADDDCEGG